MPEPIDSPMTSEGQPFEVYYDGGCPACRREMMHYRAQPSSTPIRYTDIVAEPERLEPPGIPLREAIHRLHARDEAGTVQVGMKAFLGVWLRIPRYAGLARRFEWLLTSRTMEWLYARFCDWRLPRRCRDGRCEMR